MSLDYGDPRLPDRYWRKVYPCPITGCWLWGAAVSPKGYGQVWWLGRLDVACRLMLSIALGRPLGRDEITRHTCDMPPCVNPDHLVPGTCAENSGDMIARGRSPYGEGKVNARLTERLVVEIRTRYAGGETQRALGSRFDVHHVYVGQIVRGEAWARAGGPVSRRTVRSTA